MLKKVDFTVLIEVRGANPNGDPMNGNMPRQDLEGYGEISDVCIKRKLRNRLQDIGENIFIQSNGSQVDDSTFLKDRFLKTVGINSKELKKQGLNPFQINAVYAKVLKETYTDVRLFGQVVTLENPLSIRGAISVGVAKSISSINIVTEQITKSIPFEANSSSDTMGMKHKVEYGLYRVNISFNALLGEKNGVSKLDIEKLKTAMLTMFENDESSSRPAGSMRVVSLYVWEHSNHNGDTSSWNVFDSLKIHEKNSFPMRIEDYDVCLSEGDIKIPTAKILEY